MECESREDNSFPEATLNHNGGIAVAEAVVGFVDKGLWWPNWNIFN